MSKDELPRGKAVPPAGETEGEPTELEGEEIEADEIEEAARREGEEEDELTAAHGRYINAVLDHFGADAPVYPCPTCEARGYTLAALQPDPSLRRCDACLGLGETITGSMVAGQEKRPCSRCHGNGYVEDFTVPTVTPAAEAAPSVGILPPEEFPEPVVTPLTLSQVG